MKSIPQGRFLSLDAYRGFVMLAMVSGGFGIAGYARKVQKESDFWNALGYQLDHVHWGGCSFWDLIQPSFMFIVGVAMPFSYAVRRAAGAPWWNMALHALLRAAILVFLGAFLRSQGSYIGEGENRVPVPNWIFKDVLAQIGFGYFFVFLLLGLRWYWQFLGALAILVATWFAFHQHPVMDAAAVAEKGITKEWEMYRGYAAHWNMNTNFASDVDRVFLNKFPRPEPFIDDDGYHTLNFVPSMATMLFGVVAGGLLRSYWSIAAKFWTLLLWGLAFLAIGLALDHTLWPNKIPDLRDKFEITNAGYDRPFTDSTWTICPVVKKIWTPTWAVFSTGWTLVLLSLFFGVIEGIGWKSWAFPFVVVGLNSIAIYVLAGTLGGWITTNMKRYFGSNWWGETYEPLRNRMVIVGVLWLFCYWLYRQRVFLKI